MLTLKTVEFKDLHIQLVNGRIAHFKAKTNRLIFEN